jgi:hypothetical protein
VVDHKSKEEEHTKFKQIKEYLQSGVQDIYILATAMGEENIFLTA